MKKLNLLLISLLVCDHTQAQLPERKNRIGVTGGIHAGQLQRGSVTSNLLWRYKLGLAAERRFTPIFSVGAELTYSRQGSSTPITGSGGDDRLINAFDYVNLPIFLRFSPKQSSVFIEAGGQVGLLVSGQGYFASARDQASTFRHVHSFDAGLLAGLGYRVGSHLVVNGRYVYGGIPVLANYAAPDPQTGVSTYYNVVKWYNRVWSLNLTYFL